MDLKNIHLLLTFTQFARVDEVSMAPIYKPPSLLKTSPNVMVHNAQCSPLIAINHGI